MKTICHLSRIRSALPDTGAIGFGAVTRYDLDLGMRLKPSCNGLGQAVLQYVDGTAALQINHNRAIAMPFAPGPVINPDHLERGPLGYGKSSDTSQQGIAAHRQALTTQTASTGSTPEG